MTSIISEDCYYTYKGVHYSVYFPIIWAMNNKVLTGRECPNCYTYSTEENKNKEKVFMGYCKNCNYYCYNGERIEYSNYIDIYEDTDDDEDISDYYYQENPYFRDGYDSY